MDIYYEHNEEIKKATLNLTINKPKDFVFLGGIPEDKILGSAILAGELVGSTTNYTLEGISSSGFMSSVEPHDILKYTVLKNNNFKVEDLRLGPNWSSIKIVPNPNERGSLESPDVFEYLGGKSITACANLYGEEFIQDGGVFQDFDFALIRYIWNSQGGKDLDTRTYITVPNRKENMVGWSRMNSDASYLLWNDDNTGSGVEAVLVNLKELKKDFPGQKEFKVLLRAFWYSTRASGDLTVEVNTYKGGTMSKSGYDWVNTGGTLVQNLKLKTNSPIQISSAEAEGTPLAVLYYNTETNLGSLSPNVVGEDVSGGITPEVPIVETPFVFEIYRSEADGSQEDQPISIKLSGNSDYTAPIWSLFEDDILIVENTGYGTFVSERSYVTGTDKEINISVPLENRKTYKLVSTSTKFYVTKGPSDEYSLETPSNTFDLISFSNTVLDVIFTLPKTTLKVPLDLGKSMRTISGMFSGCRFFNDPNVSNWDVTGFVVFEGTFRNASKFNQPLNSWNMSSAVHLTSMFSGASAFNQNLNSWNMSSAEFLGGMFQDAVSFNQSIASWDLSKVTVVSEMFNNAKAFNKPINDWNFSPSLYSMYAMFKGASAFNQDISNWYMGNIDNVIGMFEGASSFNQDLTGWCTAKLLSTSNRSKFSISAESWVLPKPVWGTCLVGSNFVFSIQSENKVEGEKPFKLLLRGQGSPWTILNSSGTPVVEYLSTGDINVNDPNILVTQDYQGVVVSFVSGLRGQTKTYTINGDFISMQIGDVVSDNSTVPALDYRKIKVITFSTEVNNYYFRLFNISLEVPSKIPKNLYETNGMFSKCNLFNQNINSWDMSYISNTAEMFQNCTNFNQPLDSWNMKNVSNMKQMFQGCRTFNQDISAWDISLVTNLAGMFQNCVSFNQPLNSWVFNNNLTSLSELFSGCILFNQPLNLWDVSRIRNLSFMFNGAHTFNKDIKGWDTKSVSDMTYMFSGARAFNQDLSFWCVPDISSKPTSFDSSAEAWVLPKPIWGTDGNPISDPNDLGVSDLGEPYVFSTTNVTTPTSELMLNVQMYNYTKWQLVDTDIGLVIANSRGYFAPNVRDNQSQSNAASVELRRSKTGVSNYALYVKSDSVTFSNQGSGDTVVGTFSLTQWGTMSPNPRFMLNGATTTVPDTLSEAVTSADSMFLRNNLFNQDISSWETGHLVSATRMFEGAIKFNQDIGSWDTSNVVDMSSMFNDATSFNQDLSKWSLSLIPTKPDNFDLSATAWNEPRPIWGGTTIPGTPDPEGTPLRYNLISKTENTPISINMTPSSESYWVVYEGDVVIASSTGILASEYSLTSLEGVVTLSRYFPLEYTAEFRVFGSFDTVNILHKNINNTYCKFNLLDFGSEILHHEFNIQYSTVTVPSTIPNYVTSLRRMFKGCDEFDQNLSGWDTINITNMSQVFEDAAGFNFNLLAWNTSSVTTMSGMFKNATTFDGDISSWDTSKVTDMSYMFAGAINFNKPLTNWNTTSLIDASYMFYNSTYFDQPISLWDVSKVVNMSHMFNLATNFDQDISEWRTVEVVDMSSMFAKASYFNQDLSGWCVSKMESKPVDFDIGIDNWTKFKPRWGTCPPAIPELQEPITTGILKFELLNDDNVSPLTLQFDLKGPSGIWAIRENGKVIANSQGYVGHNNEREVDIEGYLLSTTVAQGESNLYEVIGSFDIVKLMYPPNTVISSTASITEFGEFIGKHLFNLHTTTLTVPSILPPHVTTTEEMFKGADYFDQDISTWDTINVTNMASMFAGCLSFGKPLSTWNTSNVTDMSYMFHHCEDFISSVANWNTSNVTSMRGMFINTASYNQPMNTWDTSKVVDMAYMFQGCSSFNQDIYLWNTAQVTDMSYMFSGCTIFNRGITKLDVSNVTNMQGMFLDADAFNKPLNTWNVSKVRDMRYMFDSADYFNQDLSMWDVVNIPRIPENFDNNSSSWIKLRPVWGTTPAPIEATSPVVSSTLYFKTTNSKSVEKELSTKIEIPSSSSSWTLRDVSTGEIVSTQAGSQMVGVTNSPIVSSTITVLLERDGDAIRNYSLEGIFTKVGIRHDTAVGVDLTVPDGSIKLENFSESVAWFVFRLTNVLLEVPTTLPAHIKNLSSMFSYSTLFNQDISMWNTSNVTNMSSMFRNCTAFNQDISSWDTSKVTTMGNMFQTCKVFNQPIGSWNTVKVTTMTSMFNAAPAFNQDLSFWCLTNISSLPTTFDSGTTSWLPEKKPKWGTCYRGEFLTEVKTAVQPELGVKPLETVYIETDTFKFTTKSLLESISVKTLTILTPPTVNLWSLKENGKLIADHTGFSSKGISNEISVLKYNTITIPIKLIGTRDFEFVGGGEFIELIYSDAEAIKQIPSLSLTVDSFSSTLEGFRFNLPNVELTVPEALPQTITNLSHMFAGCNLFNQDISMWNTSNIIRMDNTFKDCYNFNQPISYWNTSKVTTMENMFLNCTNFNQYLNLWDSGKVRTIKGMFENCVQFNSPLNAWVLTSLGIVSSVFKNAVSFNQPLNNWDVSKVSMFDSMFEGAIKFNQDISTWNLKSALNLDSMFKEAHRFNQDLSNWCVGLIVTKPLDFDINAVSWFLPNPIWGTCPRNENLVLPPTQGEEEGLVPNLDRGPKPIMDMEAIQTSLMFSTKNQKITNKEMPLTITLNGVIGEWYLKTDGVVVADSQGTVSNLTRTTVTGDKVVLALAGNITGTVEYELNAKCSGLLMYYKTTPNITERLVGEVNLKTFSSNIDNYNFTLPYIDLKVPNALPANVLSTRLMFSECDRFNSNISAWDVSNVTTMEGMFDGCNNFSGDLSWWDVSSVTSMLNMFRNCFTFNSNLSWWFTPNVTNMSNMFFNCFVYNKPMNNWDVSNVTNTTFMFGNCRNFDQPLNRWNVSKINLMTNMFNGCSNYNQDLSYWCTTLVGAYPTSFNSNVNSWVEPVPIWGKCMRREDIPAINPSAEAVQVPNPPLGTVIDSTTFNFTTINTSDTIPGEYPIDIVITTDGTAWTLKEDSIVIAKSTGVPAEGISVVKASTPANTWTIKAQRLDLKERRYVLDSKGGSIKLITTANSNVGSVVVTEFSNKVPIQQFSLPDTTLIVPEGLPPNIINLSDMFSGCTLFNQNINMWDTSNVTNMLRMFQNCVVYNQPLSAWNTSKVTNMSYMFDHCTVFNQYIGNWNVSNVTNLSYMFNSCRNFDSYIGDWNTSKVTSIRSMFSLTMYFNQDISKWDMFKVTNMIGTFNGARSFNQDLSSWCVSKITTTPATFDTKVGVWNKPRPIWGTCPVITP